MILTIIFLSIFAISLITFVVCKVIDNCTTIWVDDLFEMITLCVLLVAGIGSLATGGIAALSNTSYNALIHTTHYEESVRELNTTYNYLISAPEGAAKYTAVQQYNSEVKEFKQDIIQEQKRLENPWVSWFHCYAFNNMDANAVQYISLE